MIGGFELPTGGRILLRDRDITMRAARQASGEHGVPALRAVPAPRRRRQHRVRAASGRASRRPRSGGASARRSSSSGSRATNAASRTSCRAASSSASRSPGRSSNRPQRAAPRRAARRPRPQAPAPAPGRAQADPVRGRDHVRLRDPRPGGGAHDERPDRGHERAARSSSSGTPEELYERPAHRASSPTSSARPTCSRAVESVEAGRRRSGSTGRARAVVAHGALGGRRAVEVSIRPESIELASAGTARRRPLIRGQVEQVAYLGGNVSVPSSARRADWSITVLAPKTGPRLPVGSDVAVAWAPSEALVLGARPADAAEEEPA